MENASKIKIALVRGNSLNDWEGALWNNLGGNFETTAFCAVRNLYNINGLNFPVKRLVSSTDSVAINYFSQYFLGIYQKMNGLERGLADFHIAHTAEISYFYTTQAVRAKKLNPRLKVVASVWDNSFGRFEYNYSFFKRPPEFWRKKINEIIRENIAGADLFLPVTKYSAEMLLSYGADEYKIKILTPAVVIPQGTGEISEKLGLKNADFYISICRMVKEKGVYDILYAWRAYIKETKKMVKLLFVGNGPEKFNLVRLSRELGLDNSVIFVDYLPNHEVRGLYKFAKGLILASLPGPLWQEQFGYVLAEAISALCPVVASRSGAIPEVVEDAGLLFSPGNPVELKEKLLEFDDPALLQKLEDNCRRVRGKFDARAFCAELGKIYTELIYG